MKTVDELKAQIRAMYLENCRRMGEDDLDTPNKEDVDIIYYRSKRFLEGFDFHRKREHPDEADMFEVGSVTASGLYADIRTSRDFREAVSRAYAFRFGGGYDLDNFRQAVISVPISAEEGNILYFILSARMPECSDERAIGEFAEVLEKKLRTSGS